MEIVLALPVTMLDTKVVSAVIMFCESSGISPVNFPDILSFRLVKNGDIVLQHFNYNDVTNMVKIIDGLRKKGLVPATLREVV